MDIFWNCTMQYFVMTSDWSAKPLLLLIQCLDLFTRPWPLRYKSHPNLNFGFFSHSFLICVWWSLVYSVTGSGCKESQSYSLPFRQPVASIYKPKSHFNQPQKRFDAQDWLHWVLLSSEFLKNFTYPSGKLRTKFTNPIAKSTSRGLSDNTLFTCY